jgi:hypothetical protein
MLIIFVFENGIIAHRLVEMIEQALDWRQLSEKRQLNLIESYLYCQSDVYFERKFTFFCNNLNNYG